VRYGACNFESFPAAVDYYRAYGFSYDDVADKLDGGEIAIGVPDVPPGTFVYVSSGRYIVETVK
jgi:hypothetical protein